MAEKAKPCIVVSYLGFIAWLAYGAMIAGGYRIAAASAGAGIMLAILAGENRRGSVKIIDCTSLGFFALAFAALLTGGEHHFMRYEVILAWGVFAAVAWVTILIGFPFTTQYAREQAPRELWNAPLFRQVNLRLTTVWALIFTIDTLLAILALRGRYLLFLAMILPGASMLFGYAVSLIYPARYRTLPGSQVTQSSDALVKGEA
jgi:hypothetical protein